VTDDKWNLFLFGIITQKLFFDLIPQKFRYNWNTFCLISEANKFVIIADFCNCEKYFRFLNWLMNLTIIYLSTFFEFQQRKDLRSAFQFSTTARMCELWFLSSFHITSSPPQGQLIPIKRKILQTKNGFPFKSSCLLTLTSNLKRK